MWRFPQKPGLVPALVGLRAFSPRTARSEIDQATWCSPMVPGPADIAHALGNTGLLMGLEILNVGMLGRCRRCSISHAKILLK